MGSEKDTAVGDNLFSPEDGPPPAPPQARRNGALFSLLIVGLAAGLVALSLRSSAAFALTKGPPQELQLVTSANLSHAPPWVTAHGRLNAQALSFRRRGTSGSFRLTRLQARPELWVVLHLPKNTNAESYVPPASFSGRLLSTRDAGLSHAPLVKMISEAAPDDKEAFFLLDGETPATHQDSLLAALILALLSLGCLGFAARLGLGRSSLHDEE